MAAEAVGSNYVIVKNILSHLTWRHLEYCKLVSTLWKELAERQPTRTVFEKSKPERRIETYNSCNVDSGRALVHVEGRLGGNTSFTLVFIGQNPSQPCSTPPAACRKAHCTTHARPPWKFTYELCDNEAHTLAVYSEVHGNGVFYRGVEGPNFSGFSFPIIDGLTVQKLTLSDMKPEEMDAKMAQLIETDIVKCILIFTNSKNAHVSFLDRQIRKIKKIQGDEHPVSVGGGVVYYLSDRIFGWEIPEENKQECTSIIIFSIAKSAQTRVKFESHSYIIRFVDSAEGVVKQISEKISDYQHSLGLIFYDLNILEIIDVKHYNKYLPSMPIVGSYTEEVVGFAKEKKKDTESIYFIASTSLVVLAWNDN